MEMNQEDLHSVINERLISSGKYKEIFDYLQLELKNSGWYDDFVKISQDKIINSGNDELNFVSLLNLLQQKGIETVPDEVKVKVMKKISEFLNNVVE